MPTTIVPSADIVRDGYGAELPSLTGAATVFGCLLTRDGASYVQSVAGSFGDVIAVETGNPTATPDNDNNHILRMVIQKPTSGGEDVAVTCQLRQAYTAETSQGTFIAAIEAKLSDTGLFSYRHRLTSAEAAAITDYTDLQLRFVMRGLKNGAPRAVRVVYAGLEVSQPGDKNPGNSQLTEAELRQFPDPSDTRGVQHAG